MLMYSNQPPSKEHIARLEALLEDVSVIAADSEPVAIQHAPDTEIILGHRYLRQTLPHTEKLKWVQSTAGGVAHLLSTELIKISPILTRCPIFADVVALHAFTLALATVRRIPEAVVAQQQGIWDRKPIEMLPVPRTAMILGVGCIGRALAKILCRQGIAVLGVNTKPSPEACAVCDELLSPANWRQHLHRADLLFICLPLTKKTTNLIDKEVLGALPGHAVLINISRGEIIDTSALIQVLNSGHLGGAALDVLSSIPESPTDPLWSTPRLLITPWVAVFHPERQKKLEKFFENQVKRYLAGKELKYIVDLESLI